MTENSPFLPGNDAAYRRWRERKLAARPRSAGELTVVIGDPLALTEAERGAIIANCRRSNLCFYRARRAPRDRAAFKRLGEQIGLAALVGNPCADAARISHITAVPGSRYIPYTNKALNWHTDGYYNEPGDTVRAFSMHCLQPAGRGGENHYLDPELIYILLRDDDPRHIERLMHPRAMTLPANMDNGAVVRPARSAPVFAVDAGGALLMRYSARARHIEWRAECRAAAARLGEALEEAAQWRISRRLAASEGVICNNVLHNRAAFEDDGAHARHLYRARYRDRVEGGGWRSLMGGAPC